LRYSEDRLSEGEQPAMAEEQTWESLLADLLAEQL
jgi:hypothetical protein